MKTAAFISAAVAFAGSALAAPAGDASQPKVTGVVLNAAHSGSPIHLQPINANGGQFWIGKNTTSYCPLKHSECPPGTYTSLLASEGVAHLAMNVEVPGGQQVYINDGGALGFTAPHSAAIPSGAKLGKFRRQNIKGQNYDIISHKGGFLACPVNKDGPYKIYVDDNGFSKKGCIGFDALAATSKGVAAWEYE